MRYKYIVIDSSNLFWRCCVESLKKLLDDPSSKIYASTIETTFKRLRQLVERFGYTKTTKIYLCFDNADSTLDWRKQLTGGNYKSARDKTNIPPAFYDTLNLFEELCRSYSNNYYIAKVSCAYIEDEENPLHVEADDLTPFVVEHIGKLKEKERILFVSADLDWARNISEQADWFNFLNIYNIESFQKKYEFKPNGSQIKMYKALKGDNSDSIPNAVPGLRKEILFDIIKSFKDPNDLHENLWSKKYPKNWKVKIHEAYQQIQINYKLVDFADLSFLNLNEVIFSCKENIPVLKRWWKMYNLQPEIRMIEKAGGFQRKKHRRAK
jgi:5'-3' exonuclease